MLKLKVCLVISLLTIAVREHLLSQLDPNQPNILIIIADDVGDDALNGFLAGASEYPITPHLDSLRSAGLTFTNAWAAPKCTPTRASIICGLYGNKTGVTDTPGNLDTSYISLFKAIKSQTADAYVTGAFGKWHISNPVDFNHPEQLGVDYYSGAIRGNVSNYYNWSKVTNGQETVETEYVTSVITDAAINWVNNQNQPWLMWMAHNTPHGPYHVPPDGTYIQSDTSYSRNKFLAMIENMDYETGRLLDSIPVAIRNNTIIIFIGDNGTGAGVNRIYTNAQSKSSIYQGGVNVPMIVSGAGVDRGGEVEDGLVNVLDIYATVLDIVGANLPGGVNNSRSFFNNLTATGMIRPYNYAENATDYTIRNEQYKLCVFGDGSREFYDVLNDRIETINLYDSLTSEQQSVVLELENEARIIRSDWSCRDLIQNGVESSIDCGSIYCFACDSADIFPCQEDTIITCEDEIWDASLIAKSKIVFDHDFTSQYLRLTASDCIEINPGFDFEGRTMEVNMDDCEITGIPDSNCPNSNIINKSNIGCCEVPAVMSEYAETVVNDIRSISSNGFPDHEYCFNGNNIPSPMARDFIIDASPSLSANTTSILSPEFRPRYFFGIAINGVLIAPAPATPFIFENTNTGEYNWDWVFEPTNVQGSGAGLVSLDCASAHTGPQGYHYHGNMFQYVEEKIALGISTTDIPPMDPIHIGWAADGFPIVYRFGPDASGNMALLKSSYRLKYGNRPGDGISEPCGSYNGRYTNDYEYKAGIGDLDECNGIASSISITTGQGTESFNYFYVITDQFPQISRCFSGTPDQSFR